MMKATTAALLMGVPTLCGLGCSADANTPQLQAALERARPDDAPPTRRVAKTALPMEGAEAHTVRETLELSLQLKDQPPQVLAITMDAVRGAWREGARFRVRQSRRWSATNTPTHVARKDSRQAVFDGSRFVSRRGHSAWRELEIWRGDHHHWLRDAYALADAVVGAYEPVMSLTRRDARDVAGVPVEAFDVQLKTPGAPPPRVPSDELRQLRDSEAGWARWLAATHRAKTLEGKLLRRAGAREIVAGRIHVSGPVEVEGTSGTFTLRWQRKIEDAPPNLLAELSVPKHGVEPARRHRPWLMIRSVLKSELADVYAKRARR